MEPAVAVADEGMGVQLWVRPDGTLDAVWTELRDQGSRPAMRLLHAVSTDRGRTFSEPAVVVELDEGGGDGVGHAALAAGDDGTLMACWPQGPEAAEGWAVYCSRFREGGGWEPPSEVNAGPDALAVSFPAVAAAGGSWWLSAYVATQDTVAVTLFRSEGANGSWSRVQSLASAPVPFDRYCPAPGLACRRDETTVFPGDYVSAAGRGDRAAMAWVLPAGGADSEGRLGVAVVRMP